MKLPVSLPLEVWLSLMVGLCEVLQHTPRAVTVAPPSKEIQPPLIAVCKLMSVIALVEIVDN